MKKIIDYSVIQCGSSTELIGYVNAYIKQGWTPLGGGFSGQAPFKSSGYLYQAMVKYEEVTEENMGKQQSSSGHQWEGSANA